MTAPIWIAFQPEVHSTSLSSGPGPGRLRGRGRRWVPNMPWRQTNSVPMVPSSWGDDSPSVGE